MVYDGRGWLSVTVNADLQTTSTTAEMGSYRYLTEKVGSTTRGIVNHNYQWGLREGQGNRLPTAGGSPWVPNPWIQWLHSTAVTPWFRPTGMRMVFGDIFNEISGTPGSSDWVRNLKRKIAYVMDQTTTGFVSIISGQNEPERPAVSPGTFGVLGGSATLVKVNLAKSMRAAREQLYLAASATIANYSTVAARPDICLAGHVWAECIRNPSVASSKVDQYKLFTETNYAQDIDVLTAHHHQAMGNAVSFLNYAGTHPTDSNGTLYHMWRDYIDSSSSHPIPAMNDEAGLHFRQPVGNLFGWGATNANFTMMDELRRIRSGSKFAGCLQLGLIQHFDYAFETGASDYLLAEEVSPFTVYNSWIYGSCMMNPANYMIGDLTDGLLTISSKGSSDLSWLPTWAIRCESRSQPQSSYGSATPPFPQWSQSSFTDGMIKFTSGSTKIAERPVWLTTSTNVYTFSAEVKITGSTLGGVKLAVCGHNKYDGTTRADSAEKFGAAVGVNSTMTVTFVHTQHTDTRLPQPNYALLQILHNGVATVEITNPTITLAEDEPAPEGIPTFYDRSSGARVNTVDTAVGTTLYCSYPATRSTADYYILAAESRTGNLGSSITWGGKSDWTELVRVASTSAAAPCIYVYGKHYTGLENSSTLDLQVQLETTSSAVMSARAVIFSFHGVDTSTAFESVGSTFITSVATGADYPDMAVTTLGDARLAVNIHFINGNLNLSTWQTFVGETGGTWEGDWEIGDGASPTIGIMYADMPSAGTIDGGVASATGTNVRTVGFALVPLAGTNVTGEGWATIGAQTFFGEGNIEEPSTFRPRLKSYGSMEHEIVWESNPIGPAMPIDADVGDLAIMLLSIRSNCTGGSYDFEGKSNWTALHEQPAGAAPQAFIYGKIVESATEAGENIFCQYSTGDVETAAIGNQRGMIWTFTNINEQGWYEANDVDEFSLTTVVPDANVACGGDYRLAINFVVSNANPSTMGSFTGETGGDWQEVYITNDGNSPTIAMQFAEMDDGGTIGGGETILAATGNTRVFSLALVGPPVGEAWVEAPAPTAFGLGSVAVGDGVGYVEIGETTVFGVGTADQPPVIPYVRIDQPKVVRGRGRTRA